MVFSSKVAPWIAERVWHPTQSLRWLPGKRLEMTLKVADTPEIRRWLLGFGDDAEVLEPSALRETLRLQADAPARKLVLIRRPLRAISPSALTSRPSFRRRRVRVER